MKAVRFDIVSNLPGEILDEILKHLTLHDLCNSQLVCKNWNEAVLSSRMWRDFYKVFAHDSCKDKPLTIAESRRQFRILYKKIKHPKKYLREKNVNLVIRQRTIDSHCYHDGKLAVASVDLS